MRVLAIGAFILSIILITRANFIAMMMADDVNAVSLPKDRVNPTAQDGLRFLRRHRLLFPNSPDRQRFFYWTLSGSTLFLVANAIFLW